MSASGKISGERAPLERATRLRAGIRAAGLIGLALIAVIVGFADAIARAPADAALVGQPLLAPSIAFPFGTDVLGRDVLSETLHALSVTISEAALAMIIAILVGGLFGFVATRLPWRSGYAMRWAAGIFASVPSLLLAILLVGLSERSFAPIAAGFAAAPFAFCRAFDRARALARSQHAEYARASGIPAMMLLRRDLAYEFRDMFIGVAARALAAVTITLSTLSFLGFGAVPPHRDLGLMIAASRSVYLEAWWTAAFPALVLLLIILCARLAAALEEGERP